MPLQSSIIQQRDFVGLDLYHVPQSMPPGALQQADNCFIDGGECKTRPGFQGKFTTPLGAPIYGAVPYIKTDLSTEIVFVSGGKLYRTAKGAATYTEILNGAASFTLNGPTVDMKRVGKYLYIVDGTVPLYKVDLDATPAATAVTSLTVPATAFTASLTNNSIDDFSSTANWTSRPAPSVLTELMLNNSFEINGGGGSAFATSWAVFGTDANVVTAGFAGTMTPAAGSYALQLDDSGEGVRQAVTCPTFASGPVGVCRVYNFTGQFHQADPTGNSTVVVTLYALDGGASPYASVSQELSFTYNSDTSSGGWVTGTATLSLASLAADPVSVQLELKGGANNKRGNNSIFIDIVSLKADSNALTIAQGTNTFAVASTDIAQGGNYIRKLYGTLGVSGKDFSGSNVVALRFANTNALYRPTLRLVFNKVGDPATTFYYTNNLTYSTDGTYASVDITTVPLAVRQAVQYLYVQIVSDMTGADKNNLFTLGPLTAAGNLSVSIPGGPQVGGYIYQYTEVQTTALGDIETDPSPVTPTINATGLQAESMFTLPAATNGAATSYNVYRFGGTITDGVGRLIANVSISGGDQAAFDATHTYTWNHTTRAFVDNTPDSALFSAITLITGRGAAPVGAQALCEWQGRLWLAKGTTLYGSWLITSTSAAALYFNAVNIPNDPYGAIKGIQFSVGGTDNDNIQTLIPTSGQLVVMKGRARRLVVGTNGNTFSLLEDHTHTGVGTIAPRAVELINGLVWTLAASGVFEFTGPVPTFRSQLIERLLNPAALASTALAAAAYKGAAMIYHSRRLYLATPSAPADTQNTVIWVWDTRQGGWTRYLLGVTGFAALSSSTDTDDLYAGGYDGQLYQFTGTGDKPTPASSAAAVTMTVALRGMGQESAGDNYFRQNIPTRLHVDVTTKESAVVALSVTAAQSPATWTYNYTLNGSYNDNPLRIASDVRGNYITATVAIPSITQSKVTSIAVNVTEGRYNG